MAGLKDQVVGKAAELKGKVTNDKAEEAKGDARQMKGKVADQVEQGKDHIADTMDRHTR